MKVLLLFPPQWGIKQPYLSLPSLCAYLAENDVDISIRDLNIESYDFLLSKDYLHKVYQRITNRLNTFESHEILYSNQQQEYAELFQAHQIFPIIEDNVEYAKNIFRNRKDFYDFNTYLEAQRILQRSLKLISAAYYPTELTLNSYTMKWPLNNIENVLKATLNRDENPFIELFEDLFVKNICSSEYDLIGISIIGVSQIIPGLTLARLLKSFCPFTHLTLGGSIFTHLIDQLKEWPLFFENFFNSVVVFEGELPLLSLCNALSEGKGLESVPNLIYFTGNSIRTNPVCKPPQMNKLPTPIFDGFPLHKYFSPELILPILSCRGCYWRKCAFCSHSEIYGNRYSVRSAHLLVEDIKTLSKKYNTKYFTINDEGIASARLLSIAKNIINEELEIRFNGDVRLETGFTDEHFITAYKAGLLALYFGLESGCDRILDRMSKGVKKADAKSILRMSSNAGIWNHVFIFFGFPGETEDEAFETMDFVFQNTSLIHSIGFTTFLLMGRTPISKEPGVFGIKEIIDDGSSILDLWKSYIPEEGIDHNYAEILSKKFSDELPSYYSNSNLWGTISREHLLLYLNHFQTRKFDELFRNPNNINENKDIKESCFFKPESVPQMKKELLYGIAKFDVARIITDAKDQIDLKPNYSIILWDFETGKTLSVTPSAAYLFSLCDGKRDFRAIVEICAKKYKLNFDLIMTQSSTILTSVFKMGFGTLEK
jgi:anaerobic magnesium-protoporphyrin IX monomethyl ester cyclase